jgi:hypothetical protein
MPGSGQPSISDGGADSGQRRSRFWARRRAERGAMFRDSVSVLGPNGRDCHLVAVDSERDTARPWLIHYGENVCESCRLKRIYRLNYSHVLEASRRSFDRLQ